MFLFYVLALGYFYCNVQRISSGVILPHIGRTFGFSAALIGFLSSLFFYTYGGSQNIWGAVSDRVGPLRSCAVGMAMAAAGSSLLLIAPTPLMIGLSRILCGLGLGAYFTGIYIYAALAFPAAEYPFWVGFVQVIGSLGTVAAVAPLGALMDSVGYRGVFAILTITALCVASVLWVSRNHPIALEADKKPSGDIQKLGIAAIMGRTWDDIKLGLRLILQNPSLSLVALAWSAAIASASTLQGLWGVSWITVASGCAQETARFWTTSVSVGLVVGSVYGIRAASRTRGVRRGLLPIVLLLSAAWLLYLFCSWRGFPAYVMGVIGFVIGACSSACAVVTVSTVKFLVPVSRAGLAIGTVQTLLYAGVIAAQWGSGLIINLFPGDAAGTYRNGGFLLAFGILALPVWLSAVLTWRARALDN